MLPYALLQVRHRIMQTEAPIVGHDPAWHGMSQAAPMSAGQEPIVGSIIHVCVRS